MTWGLLFRIRQLLKGSLWVLPVVGGVVGLALSAADSWIEQFGTPGGWDYSPSTALSVLTTVVGASVGLTGFVVTVSILVVQMSTGTFSARYMRLWYRDGTLKAVLAVLVGTFIFSYSLLRRVQGDTVPSIGVGLARCFLGAGLLLFLVFLDRVIHRLRPVKVAALVAHAGREALREMATTASHPKQADTDAELALLGALEPGVVVHSDRAGSIQAIHFSGLVGWATRNESVLVLRHATGDFVSTGVRTLEVYGTPARPAALSPAVNDPTTAVQVLNHLEDTLTLIGTTPGLTDRWEFRDADGQLRLVMPARRWEDFLAIGTNEIRRYGAPSIQVMRRLRAMLDTLQETVLPEYADAVVDELARLDSTVTKHWGDSIDVDRAGVEDKQGIGGPHSIEI